MHWPTSLETTQKRKVDVCRSHQAVDQLFLTLLGQMLPPLPVLLAALQERGAILRHAGQRLQQDRDLD